MFESLKQHPTLLNAQKQYEMLSARDQSALKLLALGFLIVLLYALCWLPAQDYQQQAEANLKSSQALLQQVQVNRSTLRAMSKFSTAAGSRLDSQQLVSSVTNLAKRHGLSLKRFEPSGSNQVKVWLEDAAFDKLMLWLNDLSNSLSIKADQISIEKDDADGLVSARLTLAS